MTGFSDAIAVRRAAKAAAEGAEFVYDIEIASDWSVGGRPNGGYLLAAMANAAGAALLESGGLGREVTAASAQYLSTPEFGPAQVRVSILRHGKSGSQVRADLLQSDVPRVASLLNFGSVSAEPEPWWSDGDAVELPDPQDCFPLPKNPPGADFEVAIMAVVEERLDPAVLGFAVGQHTNRGELRGWLTFRDDRPLDGLALVFAVDSFPPAVFDLGSMGWAPTMMLNVFVRAIPAPGPLRVRQRARLARDGTVDEVCDVWDSAGTLVAQGTQLAGFRPEG